MKCLLLLWMLLDDCHYFSFEGGDVDGLGLFFELKLLFLFLLFFVQVLLLFFHSVLSVDSILLVFLVLNVVDKIFEVDDIISTQFFEYYSQLLFRYLWKMFVAILKKFLVIQQNPMSFSLLFLIQKVILRNSQHFIKIQLFQSIFHKWIIRTVLLFESESMKIFTVLQQRNISLNVLIQKILQSC